jgi:hypothetical protein
MVIFTLLVIISIVDSKDFKALNRRAFISLGLTCALLIGGLMTIRVLIILSVMIIIFDYKYFEEFIFKYIEKLRFLNSKINNKDSFFIKSVKAYVFVILIVFSAILIFENKYLLKENNFENYIEKTSPFSYNIIRYIDENLDDNSKILNSYNTGNYLIFNDCKTFIDSRQQPFTKEFGGNDSINDYLRIVFSKNYYNQLIELCDKYNIEYVFWSGEIDVGYDVLKDFEKDFEVLIYDKVEGDNKKVNYYQYNQYLFKRK